MPRHPMPPRRSVRTPAVLALGAAVVSALTVTGLVTAAGPATAIANGTPVTEGQYRYSVKLTMTNIPRPDGTVYDSGCSGALIAPQWVITAGHCIHDVNRVPVSGPVPYRTTATLGVADVATSGATVVSVVSAVQSGVNDIALLRLARPVRGIRPLAVTTRSPQTGDILRITGWGALSDVDPAPATHLQTGQVTVSAVGDATVQVTGYAPAPDTSACLYDSGAPYVQERPGGAPVLVSIESTGPACPHSTPETTARVDAVAAWIDSVLGA